MAVKKLILVAEDEPILNEMYVETFESLGYDSVGVLDGAEALKYAQSNKIDFVVTDLKMPNMDGVTLLKELRKIDPEIPPVLIVTGFADEINSQSAIDLGAIGLITKPFNFDHVINYIENETA